MRTFDFYLRCLFPENKHLVDDLLGQANVDPSMRATQIDMDGVGRLCQAFIEITNSKELQ